MSPEQKIIDYGDGRVCTPCNCKLLDGYCDILNEFMDAKDWTFERNEPPCFGVSHVPTCIEGERKRRGTSSRKKTESPGTGIINGSTPREKTGGGRRGPLE